MKRILGLLPVLCFALMLAPTIAFAEGTATDKWDGSADTSWYAGHESSAEYHISTAEQLAGLAKLVNADPGKTNFSGKKIYLDNNLDLAGHEWISIGTGQGGDSSNYSFCGVFDGQGHVISGLYSHDSYTADYDEANNLLRNALFGNVYDGEVKNLGVEDAEIWIDPHDDSAAGKGILVDWLGKSKITNCWTSGSIYGGSKIEKNIGGIAGVTVRDCTISGCYSIATLTGNFTNSDGYYRDPNNLPCDSIGGIVGARFDGNLIIEDCWFDGKIVVNSIVAAAGGILGLATDGVSIENCMVATSNIGADSDGNSCWIAYALDGTVKNSYWPNSEKKYEPSPLESISGVTAKQQGAAISDFKSANVLSGLQANAGASVEWVNGISHPTFAWDSRNISADYAAVDAAIAKAKSIDGSLYSNYAAVEKALNAVDRTKNKAQQAEVDAMAVAIESAVAALQYKDADYTQVDAAIAKANGLNRDKYKDFTAVDTAVNSVVRGKDITGQTSVDAMAKAIDDALAALEYRDADYTKVDQAIAKANGLKKNNYKDFSAVEEAINAVVRGKNITEQDEVDAMAKAIEGAIASLEENPAAIGEDAEMSEQIPQTGDEVNPALMIGLSLIAVAAIVVAVVSSKKIRRNRR